MKILFLFWIWRVNEWIRTGQLLLICGSNVKSVSNVTPRFLATGFILVDSKSRLLAEGLIVGYMKLMISISDLESLNLRKLCAIQHSISGRQLKTAARLLESPCLSER